MAYVYVSSARSNPGVINAYAVDFQSGALVQISDSPFQAGSTPVNLVTAADPNTSRQFLFVLNHDTSQVSSFDIDDFGKLHSDQQVNITGTFPVAAAVSPSAKFLYVAYTYQNGTNNQGAGGISIFPITFNGSGESEKVQLGTPTNVNVGNNPVALAMTQYNNYLYVVDAEGGTSNPVGQVLGYSANPSTGALTPIAGQTPLSGYPNGIKQFTAGVSPSAIAITPLSNFVYVTDKISNQLIGYSILKDGSLAPMVNGPFTTQQFPVAVTIDPRGFYLYVANFNSSTVSAYSIDKATGTPTNSVGGSVSVGTNPVCITIEPALGVYLYTANQTDGTVSGQKLNPNNGTLGAVQNTPFPTSGLPSCAVSIPNGLHSTQLATTTPTPTN